jgi:hypothetical protein
MTKRRSPVAAAATAAQSPALTHNAKRLVSINKRAGGGGQQGKGRALAARSAQGRPEETDGAQSEEQGGEVHKHHPAQAHQACRDQLIERHAQDPAALIAAGQDRFGAAGDA